MIRSEKMKNQRQKRQINIYKKIWTCSAISSKPRLLIFFCVFSPIWRDWFLVGLERKLLGSTIFSTPFYFQPNTLLPHFLFFFFSTSNPFKVDHNQKTQRNNIDYLQIFYKTEIFKTIVENWATQDHQY